MVNFKLGNQRKWLKTWGIEILTTQDGGNSKCKGPAVGMCLWCSKKNNWSWESEREMKSRCALGPDGIVSYRPLGGLWLFFPVERGTSGRLWMKGHMIWRGHHVRWEKLQMEHFGAGKTGVQFWTYWVWVGVRHSNGDGPARVRNLELRSIPAWVYTLESCMCMCGVFQANRLTYQQVGECWQRRENVWGLSLGYPNSKRR